MNKSLIANDLPRAIEEYTYLFLSFLINLIFYRKKGLASAKIKNILVIKLDHIGDLILSIPSIANLKSYFHESQITLVINPLCIDIAKLIPYVDDVVCYNARFFDRSSKKKMFDFTSGINLIRNLRKRNFDLIFELRGSFVSLILALVSKSRYRLDRATYLFYRKLLNKKTKHETEIALDILRNIGISISVTNFFLKIPEDEIKTINSMLKEHKYIAIHPGGPMLLKRWSIDNYVDIIKFLLSKYPVKILLVGGKFEQSLNKSIISLIDDRRVIDLSGKITLSQLAVIMKKAILFVGNDSGPMHIAAICGTKVIGLFGPTDPKRFGPYGANCIALRKETNCLPCAKGVCKIPNYRCIDKISIEDVTKTIEQIL
ncbi:MAG: glycosyltransferase family 9 protein [bacterium]